MRFRALIVALLLPLAAALGQPLEQNPLLLDSPREPVEALNFKGETLAGKRLQLGDYRGKVVMLNFWATWCVPCLLEMPSMDRLNRRLQGRAFKLLAINQAETRAQVEAFAREHRFSFDLVLDPIGEIGSNYGANRLPMTYLIDPSGFVIRRAIGPREWDSEAAVHLFEQLLGETLQPASPTTARAAPVR